MLLMSIKEYSATRNVNDKLIRKLLAEGKIAAAKLGRTWLLDSDKVDAFFDELTTPKRQEQKPTTQKGFDYMAALGELKRRAKASCG